MVHLSIFFAVPAIAASITEPSLLTRDAVDVLNILRVIEQSYSRGALIADAQGFDGSLLGALLLGQQVDIVTQLTFAATNNLAAESRLDGNVSTQVTTLLGTFAEDISQFLHSIVEQEPNFDNEFGTRSTLEDIVNNNAFATFGYVEALAGLVSEDQTATASAAATAVSGSYVEALDVIVT